MDVNDARDDVYTPFQPLQIARSVPPPIPSPVPPPPPPSPSTCPSDLSDNSEIKLELDIDHIKYRLQLIDKNIEGLETRTTYKLLTFSVLLLATLYML